jgi:DNA-directed RNA polymerase subunit RPC12/RpoP
LQTECPNPYTEESYSAGKNGKERTMKCPHCGSDLKDTDLCSKCGRKVGPAPEIEVEYRDFKVSEYLEIRQKEHKLPSETGSGVQESGPSRTSPETTGKAAGNIRGKMAARKALSAPQTPYQPGSGRFTALTVAIFLLLLVILTGALFLWRFLGR